MGGRKGPPGREAADRGLGGSDFCRSPVLLQRMMVVLSAVARLGRSRRQLLESSRTLFGRCRSWVRAARKIIARTCVSHKSGQLARG